MREELFSKGFPSISYENTTGARDLHQQTEKILDYFTIKEFLEEPSYNERKQ